MNGISAERPIDILLVEDNPGDVRLTQEALKVAKVPTQLHTVRDGEAALAFLQQQDGYVDAPRPHLVLLDLNLPRKSGSDVLELIKSDGSLRAIPVIILSSSSDPHDVARSYQLYANCYVRKPMDMVHFQSVMQRIDEFWFTTARLPEA